MLRQQSQKNAFVGSNSQAWQPEGFLPEGGQPEPYQPPSIPPCGGTLSQGSKIQSRHHRGAFVGLAPQTKLQPPTLIYETLEISEVFINPYSIL